MANVRFSTGWRRTGTVEGEAANKPSSPGVPSASRLIRPQVEGTSVQIHAVTLSHYLLHGTCCFRARFRMSTDRILLPPPRGTDGAAAPLRFPPPASATRVPLPPLAHNSGKQPELGWPRELPGLALRSPSAQLRLGWRGKERVSLPRRALTYTDGVGEPRQSLPQQPRQQQQQGPGHALPHLLQLLRFSP